MTTQYAHPTRGFGVPIADETPHHYRLTIARNATGAVAIIEILAGSTETPDRVFIRRDRWEAISSPVQRAFNQRLKQHKLAPGRWKVGENLVDRLLGKELCVLAWAIEEVSAEQIGLAVRNWQVFLPEERWWLFGMAARDAGRAQDKSAGWRRALGFALMGGRS
jgi:hypothetical protein